MANYSGVECGRDGCRRRNASYPYCSVMCRTLDGELTRLQALYQSTDDPTLDKSAWLALVTLSDHWSAYQRARGALVQKMRNRGLTLPN